MGLSRSEQMARIKGSNTGVEVSLRRALWSRGLRYRLQVRTPAGRPDIVFPNKRVAVFIDGCFWHGCPAHYVRPRSREDFWAHKLSSNINRDSRQSQLLESAGWRVIRLWEHEVILDVAFAAEQVALALRQDVNLWSAQRRVRHVRDLGGGFEQREVVLLGAPAVVVEIVQGRRLTAKARPQK